MRCRRSRWLRWGHGAILMETWPAARLTIEPGMKKGEILRGPPAEHGGVLSLDDIESADAGADVDADALAVARR